jgi:uncharacterized protein DUF4386
MAIVSAVAGFVLMGLSGFLFFAAAGYSAQVNQDPQALLAAGGSSPDIFRWASVVDLFGYLLVAPLVAYLYQRFRDDPRTILYTAAGFAYILVGAIGAIIFLTAEPMLLRNYASASATEAQRMAITTTFTALYQIVVVGLWQTLEGIPAGVWLLGTGSNLYRGNRRALALVSFTLGSLYLLLATVRLLGL